ncbi:MAG TPA: alpha/beta family hydrolase [Marinagarivorans sp.]
MHTHDTLFGKAIIRSTPLRSPARAQLLLAHGAGAAMDNPVLTNLAELLATTCQLEVVRFEFDYMHQRRHGGAKRPPPKIDRLIDEWRSWLAGFNQPQLPQLIGGKSMGGRVATMLNSPDFNAEPEAPACWLATVCFGYPFHPPRDATRLRTAHLTQQYHPTLIIQGSRDPFGNINEVSQYTLSPQVSLEWINTGDHDLKPLKKSGLSHLAALQQSAQAVNTLLDRLIR